MRWDVPELLLSTFDLVYSRISELIARLDFSPKGPIFSLNFADLISVRSSFNDTIYSKSVPIFTRAPVDGSHRYASLSRNAVAIFLPSPEIIFTALDANAEVAIEVSTIAVNKILVVFIIIFSSYKNKHSIGVERSIRCTYDSVTDTRVVATSRFRFITISLSNNSHYFHEFYTNIVA